MMVHYMNYRTAVYAAAIVCPDYMCFYNYANKL